MYSARTAGEQQIRDATMIAGVAAREAVFADKPTHTKNPVFRIFCMAESMIHWNRFSRRFEFLCPVVTLRLLCVCSATG